MGEIRSRYSQEVKTTKNTLLAALENQGTLAKGLVTFSQRKTLLKALT